MAVKMAKIPAELRTTIARNITKLRMLKYPGRGGAKRCALDFGALPQQWSRWERGHTTPSESRMVEIATFFGTDVASLRQNRRSEPPEESCPKLKTPTYPFFSKDITDSLLSPGSRLSNEANDFLAQSREQKPGSLASFYYLALYFATTLLRQGVRMDKQCLNHILDRIEIQAALKER